MFNQINLHYGVLIKQKKIEASPLWRKLLVDKTNASTSVEAI
jgi:hypothetical protein